MTRTPPGSQGARQRFGPFHAELCRARDRCYGYRPGYRDAYGYVFPAATIVRWPSLEMEIRSSSRFGISSMTSMVSAWKRRMYVVWMCDASRIFFSSSTSGIGRLSALATRACRDALRDRADGVVRSPRLCLMLPQRYASRTREVSGIEEAVREVLPKPLSLAPSSLLFGAGAVGTRAIAEAAQQVSQRQCDAVLICAVDSYYDWEVLERLIGADQLLTADNLDGRRPGEAAVAVLLSDAQHPWSGQYGCLLRGVGLAEEPIPLGSEHPSRAEGITAALEAIIGGSRLAAGSVSHFFRTRRTKPIGSVNCSSCSHASVAYSTSASNSYYPHESSARLARRACSSMLRWSPKPIGGASDGAPSRWPLLEAKKS